MQGVSGAVHPLCFSIIRDEVPRERMGVAMGLISSMLGVGGGLGLVLSGPIVDHGSWRLLFVVGAVLGVVAIVLVRRYVPPSPHRAPATLDLPGAVDRQKRSSGRSPPGRRSATTRRPPCGRSAGVVALDPGKGGLTLRTDEGRRVPLPAEYLAHAQHGYAMTGHVSQGETVERAYLLAGPGRGSREWAYVAGSRHRIDLRVYAVHHSPEEVEDALAAAWSRSQATRLALDLVGPERRGEPARGFGLHV